MTKNMTALERSTTNIAKAFENIVIETKEDVNNYMDIANTLTESAQFVRAWVLKLAKQNVFKGVNNEVIKYAGEKFSIGRASTFQYLKIADEYLINANRSKLCAYYSTKDSKFFAFLDDEENCPTSEEIPYFEILDFSYTQIAVVMAKGIEEVKRLIAEGIIHPTNTVADIKKKLKATVEATFKDNENESDETNAGDETNASDETNANNSKVTMYVDSNGIKHTFEEVTATDSDKTVFFKTVGEFAVTVEISLLDIDSEEATAKITKYTIEK